jgi:hypothetical protein
VLLPSTDFVCDKRVKLANLIALAPPFQVPCEVPVAWSAMESESEGREEG